MTVFLRKLGSWKLLSLQTVQLNSTGMERKPSALHDTTWYLFFLSGEAAFCLLWIEPHGNQFSTLTGSVASIPAPTSVQLLHPLVRPSLIGPLISTLIPVLFQEHRDCLMIYWPDPSIRTVNHNGPSTKEEPVGHALPSYVLPLSPLLPSQSPSSPVPFNPQRLGLNVL